MGSWDGCALPGDAGVDGDRRVRRVSRLLLVSSSFRDTRGGRGHAEKRWDIIRAVFSVKGLALLALVRGGCSAPYGPQVAACSRNDEDVPGAGNFTVSTENG